MTEQNNDSDRDATATDLSRRRLLKGTTAAALVGVGVPAAGQSVAAQSDANHELPHRVTLRPGNEGEQVSYRFRVDGTVDETESTGTLGYDTIESDTSESGLTTTFVEGLVGGTVEGNEDPEDAYRFAGNIVITEYDKPVEVTLELNGYTMGYSNELDDQSDSSVADDADSPPTGDE